MKPCFKLKNGATPLFFDGNIVLAIRNHSMHPFVVWTVFPGGECEWGHYVATLEGAIEIFKEKTGLNSIRYEHIVEPAKIPA